MTASSASRFGGHGPAVTDLQAASVPLVCDTLVALAALGRQTGRDLLGKVIGVYLREAPDLIEAMAAAIAEDEAPVLERVAHRLSGSSGSLGAVGMAQLCGELEERAHRGDLLGCRPRLRALRQAYRVVVPQLEEVSRTGGSALPTG